MPVACSVHISLSSVLHTFAVIRQSCRCFHKSCRTTLAWESCRRTGNWIRLTGMRAPATMVSSSKGWTVTIKTSDGLRKVGLGKYTSAVFERERRRTASKKGEKVELCENADAVVASAGVPCTRSGLAMSSCCIGGSGTLGSSVGTSRLTSQSTAAGAAMVESNQARRDGSSSAANMAIGGIMAAL